MAEDRVFTLIGRFTDEITPALENINKTIEGFKRNVSTLSTKRGGGFDAVTKSVGKLVSSQKHLKEAIKGVGDAAKTATQELKEYKSMMGKVASAHYHINKSGTAAGKAQAQFWTDANKSLESYQRNLRTLRRTPRMGGGMPGTISRRQTRSYTPRAVSGPSPSYGGRGSRRDGANFHMAEFAFAFQVGNAISQPITNAIVAGFNIGVQLMMKPFQYVAGAFGERVQDELSDLKAAGGLFSISKRSKNPFLANIDEAIQFQQDTNETFAKMAAALPGVTNDYVQVGKRLSDTAARIVMNDFEAARQEANRIRETAEGAKFYGGAITGTGAEQQREVISTLLGELTKKATIAGLGGTRAAGGIAGAYGLPSLVERMVSQERVSMGQFQRYASVFSDPTIADALQRNIENINSTQLNTVDRYKALNKLLDEVVTPELIEKLRISVDGITQGFKATFFDPDTGLFGLGRNFKEFGRKLNAYGQYVNKAGEVVTDINKAALEDLSLFEILRDIFSNLGQVLLPIAEALPLIFDPLKRVAKILMDARHYAAEFNRTFNEYREGLKILSEQEGKGFLKESLDIRASLATLNGFLVEFGGITQTDFTKYAKMLKSEDLDIGKVLSEMINSFMKSDIAGNIGELIGSVIGTVLTMVAQVTGLIAKTVEPNKLTEGLAKGFKGAGGEEALSAIFDNVFKALFDVIVKVFELIPTKGKVLILAAVLAPALISATVLGFTSWFANVISATLSGKTAQAVARKVAPRITGDVIKTAPEGFAGPAGAIAQSSRVTGQTRGISNVALRQTPKTTKGFQIAVPGVTPARGITQPGAAPKVPVPAKSVKGLAKLAKPLTKLPGKAKMAGVAAMAAGLINLSVVGKKLAPLGKVFTSMGKTIPLLNVGFAGLDFAMRKAAGEDTGTAAAGAGGALAGGLIGGAIGTAIAPGIGTAIGSVLGSILGDWVATSLIPFLSNLPANLEQAWSHVKAWFVDLPTNLGYYTGVALRFLFDSAVNLATGIKDLVVKFAKGVADFFTQAATALTTQDWGSLAKKLVVAIWDGVKAAFAWGASAVPNWFSGLVAGLKGEANPTTQPGAQPSFSGHLGDAIASEIKNKPPGSDLLIANSSETVIPAAGGYGMREFIQTIYSGFSAVKIEIDRLIEQSEKNQASQEISLQAINQTLKSNQQQMEDAKASIKQITGVDVGPMTGAVADPFKLVEVLKSMGLQDTSFGESLTELASGARFAADQQKLAADELNAKIQELMKSGFSKDQIVKLESYRQLQGDLNTKNKLLKDSTEKLKTEFDNLPEGLRLMLAKGLNNMTVGQLQAQRIATVNSIQIGAGGVTFSPLGLPAPKTEPSPIGTEALTTNPKTGLPAWMDPTRAQAKGSPGRGFSNLYAAAAYESRMKPSGSDLLIANSSETVIPAAGGYGMREFIQTIYSGFSAVKIEIDKLVKQSEKNQASQDNTLRTINQTLKNNQQQTNMRLSKLETKFSTPTMGGLGAGSVGGGVDSFTGLAQQYGLQMTSGYRPGDPGWHGANRARDYSNSTGPTPQMLAFAQALASKYGSSLKELIYTPLGFSIKNGQVVPPIAAGTHYNHVHVAYALGKGTPAFFSSQSQAERWERSMVSGSTRVASITGNSAEGFGTGVNVTNNISITQQPGQDAEELASLVALKIGEAVSDARASSIFT